MTTPTKVELEQRIADLEAELVKLTAWGQQQKDDAQRAATASEQRWNARDPESVAVDRCVRALDAFVQTKAPGGSSWSSTPHRDVTRLLLFLADRYGARVVPAPVPDPSLAVVARLQQLELDAQHLRMQVMS